MKIIVKAKTRAKEEKVERATQSSLGFGGINELVVYKVSVKEPPVDGLANEAIVRALSKYFDVPSSRIRLTNGARSKQKIFEIL